MSPIDNVTILVGIVVYTVFGKTRAAFTERGGGQIFFFVQSSRDSKFVLPIYILYADIRFFLCTKFGACRVYFSKWLVRSVTMTRSTSTDTRVWWQAKHNRQCRCSRPGKTVRQYNVRPRHSGKNNCPFWVSTIFFLFYHAFVLELKKIK